MNRAKVMPVVTACLLLAGCSLYRETVITLRETRQDSHELATAATNMAFRVTAAIERVALSASTNLATIPNISEAVVERVQQSTQASRSRAEWLRLYGIPALLLTGVLAVACHSHNTRKQARRWP